MKEEQVQKTRNEAKMVLGLVGAERFRIQLFVFFISFRPIK